MSTTARLGLITGSNGSPGEGFDLEPVEAVVDVELPHGDADSPGSTSRVITVMVGERIALLSRHGHGSHVPAHEIDHAANLRALLAVEVDRVVAVGSSGSLADEALLAQQAGLRYAAICPVDNPGNGLEVDPLTLDSFRAGVEGNAAHLAQTVSTLVEVLSR